MAMTLTDLRAAGAAAPTRITGTDIAGTASFAGHIDIRSRDGSASAVYSPRPQVENAIEREFAELASRWHEETGMHSVQTRITSHPAYLRIIGMGERAIPLIIRDLQECGGNWYAALHAITGVSPLPADARGDIPRMKAAWLQWAREHEYIH